MRLIQTAALPRYLDSFTQFHTYCGLDSACTLEIYQKLPGKDRKFYNFQLAMQAPLIEMMQRGILVDQEARNTAAIEIAAKVRHYEELLDYTGELAGLPRRKSNNRAKLAVGDYDAHHLNARSGPQLKAFFYDFLGIAPIKVYAAGEVSYAMNEEVLEKLREYLIARPVATLVSEIRRLQEELKRLRGKISSDGRAHTSYKLAGTTTGRLASSGWIDDTDLNLQNVAPELRPIYISDPGWKFCSIDLEQAESRLVGWLCGTMFGMWKYLDFCEKSDLHSYMCSLAYPDLPWTGDYKKDKLIAKSWGLLGTTLVPIESLPTGALNIREKFKKVAHGTSYKGGAKTIATNAQLPVPEVHRAQDLFLQEFPEIKKYQDYVIEEVSNERPVSTIFGLKRNFLTWPKSPTTHKEAIAFIPQGSVGTLTNLGLYRVWKHFGARIRLHLQVHDNIVFSFREDDDENEIVSQALEQFEVPLSCAVRQMKIPGEAYTGWNWGYREEIKDGAGEVISVRNPRGLQKWVRPK